MKRELILIRHTKSSWKNPLHSDFERPIDDDRRENAVRMAKTLRDLKLRPELIICSPAQRTSQTAEYFCDYLKYDVENVKKDIRLYESSAEEYLRVLNELEDDLKNVIMIGHNPSITHFANLFINEKIQQVPTTGVVWIEFNHPNWKITPSFKGNLKYFLTPKTLKDKD